MISAVVVGVDEVRHRGVQPPGARVDEQVQSGLERLVKALQLALGLRVMGRAVDMADAEGPQVVLKTPWPLRLAAIWDEDELDRAESAAWHTKVH